MWVPIVYILLPLLVVGFLLLRVALESQDKSAPSSVKTAVKKLIPLWILIAINVAVIVPTGRAGGFAWLLILYLGTFDLIYLLAWGIKVYRANKSNRKDDSPPT